MASWLGLSQQVLQRVKEAVAELWCQFIDLVHIPFPYRLTSPVHLLVK